MEKASKFVGKAHDFILNERHVQKIDALIDGKPYFPELIEIFPSNICNHHCTFCISAESNSAKSFIDTEVFYNTIREAAQGGVSKIRLCGGGEPLLHKSIVNFITFASQHIESVSLITNGSLMTDAMREAIVNHCNDVRFSIDAGNAEVYAKMHGTSHKSFDKTLHHISKLIKSKGKAITPLVELSFVATSENIDSLPQFIEIATTLQPNSVNITTNTLAPLKSQIAMYKKVKAILNNHTGSNVPISANISHSDAFEETSEPCPAFLLYGVVTSKGTYYSSCHHVERNINSLGTIHRSYTLKTLLSDPKVIQKQLKYAFGKDVKTEKLYKHPYNEKLLELMVNSKQTLDKVTTWMSKNITLKID
ncbi:molybdenum cofactor biosynthesis protein A [Kordia sp. SMS9]|uniref:radical SAM protein n=1 Tax=Kordia sp. SMS9 TaxID=2282170 RepID=UPI000E0D6A73|nr:radical SAM protein [Kordia sp. SMS9]AXG69056.1 molybdenum cofactor biosynthesis protein A [Kordia sp. SMS9]